MDQLLGGLLHMINPSQQFVLEAAQFGDRKVDFGRDAAEERRYRQIERFVRSFFAENISHTGHIDRLHRLCAT